MIAVKLMALVLVSALALRWLRRRRWFRVFWWTCLFCMIAVFLWETASSLHLFGG